MMLGLYNTYVKKLETVLDNFDWEIVHQLTLSLQEAWRTKNTVFLCGNGGSAGNAIHLANDFNYGIDKNSGIGLSVEALTANASVLTCLANDIGYENIFSQQLQVKANPNDVLIVLSGSGNSPNVVKALDVGNELGMKTFAILGYSGGKCKKLAQVPIHFEIEDMQISEDLQVIVGHMCMQWLATNGKGAI
jgi:D-sedoheptulose 7-phosphate isomerase